MSSLYFFIPESPSFPFANRVRIGDKNPLKNSPIVGKNQSHFLTKNVVEGIVGTFSSIAGQIRFATVKNFVKTQFFLVII